MTRERIEPGIFRRRTAGGAPRYEVRYRDAKGVQRWRTTRTLADARALRVGLLARRAAGDPLTRSRETLAEYAAGWLQRRRLRPASRALYGSLLRNQLDPYLGRRRLETLTADDAALLVRDLEQAGLAPATVRAALSLLSGICASAVRSGILGANPVAKLERGERPTVARREFPRLDREQVAALIAATPERYRVAVAVSALVGLRQGELLALRWDDVDLAAGLLRVRVSLGRDGERNAPKTAAGVRDVPLPPALVRMLREHKLASPFPRGLPATDEPTPVFCSLRGAPLQARNLSRRGLEPALRRAGLPHLRWHDLRHVAASSLIAAGLAADDVARILGHSSAAVTLRVYAHDFDARSRHDRVRDSIETAYGGLL